MPIYTHIIVYMYIYIYICMYHIHMYLGVQFHWVNDKRARGCGPCGPPSEELVRTEISWALAEVEGIHK